MESEGACVRKDPCLFANDIYSHEQHGTSHSDNSNRHSTRPLTRQSLMLSTHQAGQGTTSDQSILWASVVRDDIVLVQAFTEGRDKALVDQSHRLLAHAPTVDWFDDRDETNLNHKEEPSWAHIQQQCDCRGLKFHIYEEILEQETPRVWSFCCLYNPCTTSLLHAKSFLEKIAMIAEIFMETDATWRQGGTNACESIFCPILKQRMHEMSYMGNMTIADEELEFSSRTIDNNRILLSRQKNTLGGTLEEQTEEEVQEMLAKMEEMNRHLADSVVLTNESTETVSPSIPTSIAVKSLTKASPVAPSTPIGSRRATKSQSVSSSGTFWCRGCYS